MEIPGPLLWLCSLNFIEPCGPVIWLYILDFKLSPCFICNAFSFGYLPGVRVLKADVSEFSVGSIFIGRSMTCLWRWNRERVPKRRLLALGRRGDTQKKTHGCTYLTSWRFLGLYYNCIVSASWRFLGLYYNCIASASWIFLGLYYNCIASVSWRSLGFYYNCIASTSWRSLSFIITV